MNSMWLSRRLDIVVEPRGFPLIELPLPLGRSDYHREFEL